MNIVIENEYLVSTGQINYELQKNYILIPKIILSKNKSYLLSSKSCKKINYFVFFNRSIKEKSAFTYIHQIEYFNTRKSET